MTTAINHSQLACRLRLGESTTRQQCASVYCWTHEVCLHMALFNGIVLAQLILAHTLLNVAGCQSDAGMSQAVCHIKLCLNYLHGYNTNIQHFPLRIGLVKKTGRLIPEPHIASRR